ncbi:MAG: PhnD/SsuA/transferrin family substrate-binding protein [Myxococcales bacterium]|nr:PhnD/SsuA/transferrin family substrate-binding protein [Myxococcales bacterium]
MKRDRSKLVLGAVAYDAKVVTIWDGFLRWFEERSLPFDYVLYTNYERQVEGMFLGEHHVSWNSPLAWLQAERLAAKEGRVAKAIAMRDSDQDLRSAILVRKDSDAKTVADLRGKRVGVGAWDSPQATILPMLHLADNGLDPERDAAMVAHDVLVGKHGDHIGGERDAVKALLAGTLDAACVLDANVLGFARDGTVPAGALRTLAVTEPFDHCNFTILEGNEAPAGAIAKFTELLLSQDYNDPAVRPLMDLEGLKAWKPGRTEGYAPLARAIDRFRTIDPWLAARAEKGA